MASPITIGGLASGLDTDAIISALVGVESRKVGMLRSSKSGFQKKVDALDDLLEKLRDLETSLKTLSDPRKFVAHQAKLSTDGEDHVAVTLRGEALGGSYEIAVGQLAQSTFLRSDGFADPNADLALAGNLTIDVGGTQTTIAVSSANSTLNGIRDAINDADLGAVATTVFDGTDWHLELRGEKTGATHAVAIVAEPASTNLGATLNVTQIRAAQDAAFTIDGQAYTSDTNTAENAIQGVTLQLLSEQAVGANPIQLTIAEDFAAIEKQLKDFVADYNDVIEFLNAQSKPRSDSDEAVKPLAGDSVLRSLRSALGTAVGSATTLLGLDHSSLSSIGVTTQNDGTLELDSADLKDALSSDLDGVKKMISDATGGVGGRLLDVVELRTKSGGSIQGRQDAFRASMESLDDRILRAEDQLDVFEQSLRRKYAAMETLVGRLQSQGTSLGSILASWSGR